MSGARRVIRQILKLQDLLWDEIPEELKRELYDEEGSVGVLEVFDESGKDETIYLKLVGDRVVEIPEAPYRHKVVMDIDTFLDLVFEDVDFAELWASGRIKVIGEDYAIHAIKWSKWFKLVRDLVRKKLSWR